MKIISSKYLLDQKKIRLREQEEQAFLEQQKLQQQQVEKHKTKIDKIREGLRLSYVAYNNNRVAQHYLTDHGFSHFLPLNSWIGTQGLCCIRGRQACLAFRGTDAWPDLLRDATVDFLFIPWYRPTVHLGFGLSWRSVQTEVRKWLELHQGEFDRIALYGHSLGGAIAHVAALELASDYDIAEVVTFGAPRSSFLSTGELYDEFELKTEPKKTLRSVTLRVVNKLDIISKVPFSWQGYHHVGKLVYLSSDGRPYYEDDAWRRQLDEGFLEPIFKLFEQENSALYHSSTTSLITKPTVQSSFTTGISNNHETWGHRLLHFYRQVKLYIPFIQVTFQALFILIAPFILLAGMLLYLSRSGKSHFKTEYAIYFSDATTQFEKDLEQVNNKLGIQSPSKLKTIIGRLMKTVLILIAISGILYLVYWLFISWTWPLLIDWIQNYI